MVFLDLNFYRIPVEIWAGIHPTAVPRKITTVESYTIHPANIGKAVVRLMTENYMIQNSDAQNFACAYQAARTVFVLFAGCRVSGGVVMDEDQRCCAVSNSRREDFPWMNNRCIQASNRHKYFSNQPVFRI